MPRRGPQWIWAGRVIFVLVVAAVVTYLVVVGPDKADKVAGGIGVVVALLALGAPYLLHTGAPPAGGSLRVADTGRATTGPGGSASTGLRAPAAGLPGEVVVEGTGDADARGGGHTNTGVELT